MSLEAPQFGRILQIPAKILELRKVNEDVRLGTNVLAGSLALLTAATGIVLNVKEADHPEIIIPMGVLLATVGLTMINNGLKNS